MKRIMWAILFAVPIVITILPLLRPEYFSMHDFQHIARLHVMEKAILSGVLYPRWVEEFGYGFGYPLFNFYPPLIYIVAISFRLLGFSLIGSIKIMITLGYALSFIGMFLLMKRISKHTIAAYCGALLYLLAPYHAVLVYVRGAFAEFFGYALLPWVVWGYLLLRQDKRTVPFILATALLLLAHPFVSFPVFLMGSLFIMADFFVYKLWRNPAEIARILIGIGVGVGLSAFYWMPSMMERSETLVNKILLTQLADYAQHFLYIRQLWHSPWGYGGSIYGLLDGMSFEIGKLIIVLAAFGTGVTLFYWKRLHNNQKIAACFIYSAAFLAAFMTTFKSKPLWDFITYLHYLQFPWRFLVLSVFGFSIAASLWLAYIPKKIAIAVTAGIFMFSLFSIGHFQPQRYVSGRDEDYIIGEAIRWDVSRSSYEFMYKDVQTRSEKEVTRFAMEKKDLPAALYKSDAQVTVNKDAPHDKQFTVNTRIPTTLTLERSYFPGWKAWINGNEAPIIQTGPAKAMQVKLASTSTVRFAFTNTPIRTIAELISLLSLFALAYLVYKESRFSSKSLKPSQ